jgi:hypothetical protein
VPDRERNFPMGDSCENIGGNNPDVADKKEIDEFTSSK